MCATTTIKTNNIAKDKYTAEENISFYFHNYTCMVFCFNPKKVTSFASTDLGEAFMGIIGNKFTDILTPDPDKLQHDFACFPPWSAEGWLYTIYAEAMLVLCWSTVYDAGPASSQHWLSVMYLLPPPPPPVRIVCGGYIRLVLWGVRQRQAPHISHSSNLSKARETFWCFYTNDSSCVYTGVAGGGGRRGGGVPRNSAASNPRSPEKGNRLDFKGLKFDIKLAYLIIKIYPQCIKNACGVTTEEKVRLYFHNYTMYVYCYCMLPLSTWLGVHS